MSYGKLTFTNGKYKKQSNNTKTSPKCSNTRDCGAIFGISWSNESHLTGVVKAIFGYPNLPATAKTVSSKGHTFKFVNHHPYKERGPTANQSLGAYSQYVALHVAHNLVENQVMYTKN